LCSSLEGEQPLNGVPRGLKHEPLQQPVVVVPLAELFERLCQFLKRREVSHPEQLLFEGAEEALDAAVPFGARTKAGDNSIPGKAILD